MLLLDFLRGSVVDGHEAPVGQVHQVLEIGRGRFDEVLDGFSGMLQIVGTGEDDDQIPGSSLFIASATLINCY